MREVVRYNLIIIITFSTNDCTVYFDPLSLHAIDELQKKY